ncbi:putative ATP-dependent RNA helicase spindle-E [Eufriesea mexicana]|nr:putative ATP-dependent RNA helicase spindle-E [Eufriesea mexicana]
MLAGPTSRKNIPENMSLLDIQLNISTSSTTKGTDYALEYIRKEEAELLQSSNYYDANKQNDFETVSQGSAIQDIQNEKTLNIYETYPFAQHAKSNLIINSKKNQIVSMIETNSVVVIQGPTGCGKTTQVPQFILDNSYQKRLHCNIIVTQPRRIAAISIAKRVSAERNWPLGTLVGYQVGLINHVCKDTRLTYCTTGVLLHKLINSKNMLDYTHVILDEVHERDQDMDFLLLVVRKLLHTNSRSVKVILMSATFEVEKFAKYFSSPVGNELVPAPVIDISKKTYFNVGIYYLCQMGALGPIPEVSAMKPSVTRRMIEFCVNLMKVLDEVDMKADDVNYDPKTNVYDRHVLLIFLPGIHEIEEMNSLLSLPKHEQSKWDIVILHSSITSEEQQRIFQKPPYGYRRVILSTNIAESSITVPDVKYVIDFCLTKQLIMDPQTNFQCLELRWASKVNCDQRAGRAGRVMDGRVYRLVPQAFYKDILPQEVLPEILRAPLENLVLKAKLLDMGEPKAILALSLDPPDLGNLERTILMLKEVGALTNKFNEIQPFDGELTDLGRVMANLPLNIQLSKLIMLGHIFSVLKDTIIIAASLSVKDVFNNPFQQKLLAYNVRLSWAANSCSDCVAFMNVYKVWITEKVNRRLNNDAEEKKWAMRNFVQIRVLREIKALVTELTTRLERLGIQESAGINKVVWKEEERPIVLKIAIAGAFYPNYFVKYGSESEKQLKEHADVKLLGGLDPLNTVYLQGWPLKQPGLLYARRIQDIFKDNLTTITDKMNVSFDASSLFFTPENLIKSKIKSELPGLRITRIPLLIQNIKNPGCFWAQIRSSTSTKRLHKIKSTIEKIKNQSETLKVIPDTGTLVIAPYEENNLKAYFRAVVLGHITLPEILVQVFFIDYGYSSECRLCDLKRLNYDCDISDVPALAFECKLANIEPSGIHNFTDDWSQAACDLFWTLINKPGQLIGDIYSVVNSIVMIELMHKNETGEEISINQCLIEKRLAIKKEENYFSRFNHNLRLQQSDLSDEQCYHYEKLQYNQDYIPDIYPNPPAVTECCTTVNLRGPFSPLELELTHLVVAGRDKKVNMVSNSVNSVLLDTDPEDFSQRLLVAGSVSQSVRGHNLTLYNTTLMPRIPGLTVLLTLIFTPYMELRRNNFGTYYTGALCGLGFDPVTKRSLFPEHDIEIHFDVEITITDLQFINRLRHWMNFGMQINHQSEGSNNMEEFIICQNRIKNALLNLIEKERKVQTPELIKDFDKWNLYDKNLLLHSNKPSIITSIYRLHNALELEETSELQEITEHVMKLRELSIEDPRKPENTNIPCKLCNVVLSDIFELRRHLYTLKHRQNEDTLGIKL